ncbi:MAG: hypothetical protein AB7F99_00160 [Vicinamibacterales bacterium]
MTVHAAIVEPDFQARWAAWQARGVQHDRAVRQRLMWVVGTVVLGLAIWSLNIIVTG